MLPNLLEQSSIRGVMDKINGYFEDKFSNGQK